MANERAQRHLSSVDPILGNLMREVGPMKLMPRKRQSPFAALVHGVVHQQLSGKAAATIFARFVKLFPGGDFPTPRQVLAAEQNLLRSAGLSTAKAGYIKNIAEKTIEGVVPAAREISEMTDGEIMERLTSIKGIGRWTVEMLLIFNLGRSDVLPIHDLGVRKGFQIAYRKRRMPEPETLERLGEKWKPFRTTAALYLWRATDSLNGEANGKAWGA